MLRSPLCLIVQEILQSSLLTWFLVDVSGSFWFFIFSVWLGVWVGSCSDSLTPDGAWVLSALGSRCIRLCLASEVVKMKMSLSQFQTAHICI